MTVVVMQRMAIYLNTTCVAPSSVVIQQHYGRTASFNRTWAEFKVEFGDVSGNYWIGNERLHQLTLNERYKLRIDLRAKYDYEWYWAEYMNFFVDDESAGYRLYVGGYSGTAGNCMSPSSGMKFTTRDRDNDLLANANCAVISEGAGF